MEMVKYQTTDDIWGFTSSGKRKDSDYQTSYILHNNIQLTPKDSPLASLELHSESDQKYLEQGFGGKSIIYRLDTTQRMKWYQRYPSNTIVLGLSRAGGILALLNIVGIIALFAHQILFENKLRRLDEQLYIE